MIWVKSRFSRTVVCMCTYLLETEFFFPEDTLKFNGLLSFCREVLTKVVFVSAIR